MGIALKFVAHDGTETDIETAPGLSIMEVAINNDVAGITADCGGACACATCHVYIAAEWRAKIAPQEGFEKEMLEHAIDVTEDSRLSCQVQVTPDLDGIVVRTPASQF